MEQAPLLSGEAYDSYYEHHAPSLFSYWGILGYDPQQKLICQENISIPFSRFLKFVSPGSFQLAVSGKKTAFTVLAFQDGMTKDVSIVGINTSGKAVEMDAAFKNLPAISRFEMYYTNSTENLHKNTDAKVNASAFSVTIPPANCIFTLRSAPEENKPGTMIRPEPGDWYAGRYSCHRNCGDANRRVAFMKNSLQ